MIRALPSANTRSMASALALACAIGCMSPASGVGAEPSAAPEPDAQRNDTFAFGLGVANLQVNDALVRSLRYNGVGGELALRYARDGRGGSHIAGLRFPMGVLRNRYDHRALGWDSQLDYAYVHRIADVRRTALFVGARLRWDWAVQYYRDFDEEHLYWVTSYELAPALVARREVGARHGLAVELELPIVAAVSRPPVRRFYKIDRLTHADFFFTKTHESMRITSVHQHVASRARVDHVFRVGESVALRTRFAFDFLWDAEPRRVLLITQSLSFGVDYAF